MCVGGADVEGVVDVEAFIVVEGSIIGWLCRTRRWDGGNTRVIWGPDRHSVERSHIHGISQQPLRSKVLQY